MEPSKPAKVGVGSRVYAAGAGPVGLATRSVRAHPWRGSRGDRDMNHEPLA